MSNYLIKCNSCGATNRIDGSKLNDKPICGKCGKQLRFTDKPIDIHNGNFKREITEQPGFVLVDFWAPWCGPCKMMSPILQQLAKNYAGKIRVGKINTEKNQQLAAKFNIRGIPHLILFKGGKKIKESTGALPKARLESWLKSAMK